MTTRPTNCGCGASCSQADATCAGSVVATRYEWNVVSEHLCETHRVARKAGRKTREVKTL